MADFRTEPLRVVYDRLADLESTLMDLNGHRFAVRPALDQVRELLDLLRPLVLGGE